MVPRRLELALLAVLLLPACKLPSGPPPDSADGGGEVLQATLGPGGGVLSLADGRVSLTVPAGALAEPTTLTLQPATLVPSEAIGPVFEIGPSGLTFKEPVVLSFAYEEAALGDVPASALRVSTVGPDGGWLPVSLAHLDAANRRVSGMITHLTPYGLMPYTCKSFGGRPFWDCSSLGPLTSCLSQGYCGIPCTSTSNCPDPLYCVEGSCAFKACNSIFAPADEQGCGRAHHFCRGYGIGPGGFCDRSCQDNAGCPGDQWFCATDYCYLKVCRDDSSCGYGNVCQWGIGRPYGEGWGGGMCLPQGSPTHCVDHSSCPPGHGCDAGNCVACTSDPTCQAAGQTCSGYQNCCASPASCLCDASNCVCSQVGNGCLRWNQCTPSGSERCGDGLDNNCNGQADEGCAGTCLNDTDCLSMQFCDGGTCGACNASCEVKNLCDGVNLCRPLGNGCTNCGP